MTIKLHTLNDAPSFPKNVQEIVNLLHQPPPYSDASEALPCEGSPSATKDVADEKLGHISHLIALTCASMKDLATVEDELGPRYTRTIWHSFFEIVARTINKDTIQVCALWLSYLIHT